MKVFNNTIIPKSYKSSAIAVGNFDGVHKGHQKIFKYAKKIVMLFAKQKHPLHKHRLKEETFQVLSGVLESTLNGRKKKLSPGDTILVKPGVWHEFRALNQPCIFEEVSTTSYNDDSFYKDISINKLKREKRKTRLNNFNTSEL